MPTPRIIWQGNPGEVYTNETDRFKYQMVCDLVRTCGTCLQYHLAISNWWPIPFHRNCRCSQRPIKPGQSARPFQSFRDILNGLDPAQQTAAIGKSNYRLLEAGAVKWEDIVTPTRVRSLKEVVAARKLTIPAMERAGVRPDLARNAFEAVHTPQQELIRKERKELVEKLEAAGLSKEQIVEAAARGIHRKVSIGGGPSKAQAIPEPKRPDTLPGSLKRAFARFGTGNGSAPATLAVTPAPAAAPAVPKTPPYTLDVKGNLTPEDVAEYRGVIEALPAKVLEAIDGAGIRFVAAEKIADFMPQLAKVTPRGWPDGLTWEHAEGLYNQGRKAILACKTRLDTQSNRPIVSSRRLGILRHETGHGFDHAIGGSSHPDFRGAYTRDIGRIAASAKGDLGYYLQSGDAGREETFAEVFAQINGGGSMTWVDLRAHFPECVRVLEAMIAEGGTP